MNTRPFKFDAKEIAEYCKTHTDIEAEIHFDCSRGTVFNACRKYDVLCLSKPQARRARVAEWIKSNPTATLLVIAGQFRVARQTAQSICSEFGLKPAKEHVDVPVGRTQFEVLALLWQGSTQTEIAENLCVSRQRVEQIQRKAEEHGLFGKESILQLRKS